MQKQGLFLVVVVLAGCANQGSYQYEPKFNNYLSLPEVPAIVYDARGKEDLSHQNYVRPLGSNYNYEIMRLPELERKIAYTVKGNTRDVDCGNVQTTLLKLNQQLELMQRDASGRLDFKHPELMTDTDFQRNHAIHLLAWKLRSVCGK